MTVTQLSVFVGICSISLAYEVILGIVRTTDYYEAHYHSRISIRDNNIAAGAEAI
jgi:hypothetical protein